MSMTLEFADAIQSIRLKYKSSNSIAIERAVITRAEWDAIDAHFAQPAQSVDVEKVREVIADLRDPWMDDADRKKSGFALDQILADKLEAAINGDTP